MKKGTTYFIILIITLAIVGIGFALPVSSIKSFTLATYNAALNPLIAISAATCAFIFINNKHYYLIILASGIITAVIVLLLNNKGLNPYGIISRTTAFAYICYALNYIRFIIGK